MPTVSVNPPKTPVTKGSSGVAAATLPNICKMPGPPAPFVPTPLPNIGTSDNSPQGYSTSVTIEGQPVAIQGATFASKGDVASQGTGGGLISSNVQGPTSFVGPGSMNVMIEGKAVQLLGDPMLNNGGPSGTPPNAATMGGVIQAPGNPPAPAPAPVPKKVLSVEWKPTEAWCSESVSVNGKTQGYATGAGLTAALDDQGGSMHQKVKVTVLGDAFAHAWTVREVLPKKHGKQLAADTKLDATVGGVKASAPLTVKFVTKIAKVSYAKDRIHFDLSMDDGAVTIASTLKYVQGWAGEVVELGNSVPAATGGLLDGKIAWAGMRWMKNAGLSKKFWDGSSWQPLPAHFRLRDENNFAVGFYAVVSPPLVDPVYRCQYGGQWPEQFTDWSIDAPKPKKKIADWTKNIETTWVNKFALKRVECTSRAKTCCRHDVKLSVAFSKDVPPAVGRLPANTLVIADGNIRSNDSLFFLGESRIAMAAHEFGHHIGNPDEYAGAEIDPTLNTDGATLGIDPDSIMGQNLTKVKSRHFRVVCQVLADAVKSTYSKTVTYTAVKP